jgi:hypothetical protein
MGQTSLVRYMVIAVQRNLSSSPSLNGVIGRATCRSGATAVSIDYLTGLQKHDYRAFENI